jgi:hypothetical protein
MRTKKGEVTAAGAAALAAAALIGSFALTGFAGGANPSASAGQYQYGDGKVTICHHAKGKRGTKHVTIRVSRNALPAHLRHGDTVGACTTKANRAKHASKAHAKTFHKATAKHKAKAVQRAKAKKGKGKKH